MKSDQRHQAIILRQQGYSIRAIAAELNVAKSSVSLWVRNIQLKSEQISKLKTAPFTSEAIEKRRAARLMNEDSKRRQVIDQARSEIPRIRDRDLWLMGVMLYWAEGGKTRRMVRFSNGDPKMICIMMRFFRVVCHVPPAKLRGHIHIHEHLDYMAAERYWSGISGIPLTQFFKTYQRPTESRLSPNNTLPYGVIDIYVLDTSLFYRIVGWAAGIFDKALDK